MSGLLRRFWWAAALVVFGTVSVAVWLTLASNPNRDLPPARARVYSQFSACLLTDSGGVSGAESAPVWAGMQEASLKTLRKVSYLEVSGPDTVANAESFVNALVQRKCDLVLAVDDSEVAAAEARAKGFPSERFVVVGKGVADGNLAVIPVGPAEQVRSAVAQAVESAPEQ